MAVVFCFVLICRMAAHKPPRERKEADAVFTPLCSVPSSVAYSLFTIVVITSNGIPIFAFILSDSLALASALYVPHAPFPSSHRVVQVSHVGSVALVMRPHSEVHCLGINFLADSTFSSRRSRFPLFVDGRGYLLGCSALDLHPDVGPMNLS